MADYRDVRSTKETIGRIAKTSGTSTNTWNAWAMFYEGNIGAPGGTSPFFSIPVSGATLPTPADLTVAPYVLPQSFVDGDDVAVLPNGLGWYLLMAGSDSVNGSSWNSDQTPATFTTNSGTTPHLYAAYTEVSGLNMVTIQFDTELTTGDLTASDYSVSGMTVSSAANGFANGQIILTVTGTITAGATVSIPISAGMNGHGASAAATNQTITLIEDRYKYVLCANFIPIQSYIQGNVVGISTKTAALTDANGITKNIPLVYPLDASFFKHDHSGPGYGGPAYAQIISFTPGRIFEIGGSG